MKKCGCEGEMGINLMVRVHSAALTYPLVVETLNFMSFEKKSEGLYCDVFKIIWFKILYSFQSTIKVFISKILIINNEQISKYIK